MYNKVKIISVQSAFFSALAHFDALMLSLISSSAY